MDKEKDNKKDKEKGLLEDLLGDVLNFDRGLPATILNMFTNPGLVVETYFVDRKRFVNPIRYTIFLLTVVTAITTFFVDYEVLFQRAMDLGANEQMEDSIALLEEKTGYDINGYVNTVTEVSVFISTKINQLLYIIVLAPILAFFSRLFFKKIQPNYKQHYVMFLYQLATYSLFSLLFLPMMMSEFSFSVFSSVTITVQLAYTVYVQAKYLKLDSMKGYVKSGVSFLISYVVFGIALNIIIYLSAFGVFMFRA